MNLQPTDRITRLRTAHPWLEEGEARALLMTAYSSYRHQAAEAVEGAMEAYTTGLCYLSEKKLRDTVSICAEQFPCPLKELNYE